MHLIRNLIMIIIEKILSIFTINKGTTILLIVKVEITITIVISAVKP